MNEEKMATVRLPSPLRPYANGQTEIQLDGSTVEQAMHGLTGRFPQLQPHLYAGDGNLRAFVHLFVNDEDIDNLQGLNTPLNAADRVMIIPSVAGGSWV
jgi:sulfur-carrier protein